MRDELLDQSLFFDRRELRDAEQDRVPLALGGRLNSLRESGVDRIHQRRDHEADQAGSPGGQASGEAVEHEVMLADHLLDAFARDPADGCGAVQHA